MGFHGPDARSQSTNGKVKMKEIKDDQTCLGCRFFRKTDDAVHAGLGYCQRYAPRPKMYKVVFITNDIDRMAVWPLVQRDDSCGEWEGKEGEGYKALVVAGDGAGEGEVLGE